jgi:16S rRNA (cytidine1402-2'-O)-methyltransferase
MMLGWSVARRAASIATAPQILPTRPTALLRVRAAVQLAPTSAASSTHTLCTATRGFLAATRAVRSGTFHYRKNRVTAEDAIDPLTKPLIIDKGALHVVSVPIGNLKDFTLRALDVLREVDYIITTDRPATKTLLDLVHIPNQGRLIHYSRSNRTATREKLVELLKGGRSMAFVTTSGTPCVGDVGGELVQEMQRSGIRVTAVPGASAVMSALAVSGLTTSIFESSPKSKESGADGEDSNGLVPRSFQDGSFFFGNVLPESHGARLRLLRTVVGPATYPCVFYEVPRRLVLVLQDIAAVLPHRRVYVTHELTKLNESLHADTAERLVAFYLRQEAQLLLRKGQLVLVVAGAGPAETAAWLAKEAAKRRRLRRPLKELMMQDSSSPSKAAPSKISMTGDGTPPQTTKKATRLQRRKARLQLRRERQKTKRVRLIQAIEAEQERLRMNLTINRHDASRLD